MPQPAAKRRAAAEAPAASKSSETMTVAKSSASTPNALKKYSKKTVPSGAKKSVSFHDEKRASIVGESKRKEARSDGAITRATPRGVITPHSSAQRGRGRGGARSNAARPVKRAREEPEGPNDSGSGDDDDSESDSDDDLSDVANADSSDDDDESRAKQMNAPKKRGGLNYTVLQLRHLPKEFQESELAKFFGQFGTRVTNCFCVRSRRTQESKGTAYVQFADESVIPLALEECDGMFLGGRTVRARARVMHRPMPLRDKIRIRRLQGLRHQAHGPRLDRFDKSAKSLVGQLIKYSRSEKKNNAFLKSIGINYESHTFGDQLHRLPREAFRQKQRGGGDSVPPPAISAAAPSAETPSSAVGVQATSPAGKPQQRPRKERETKKVDSITPPPSAIQTVSPAGVRLPAATSAPKKESAPPAKKPAAKRSAKK